MDIGKSIEKIRSLFAKTDSVLFAYLFGSCAKGDNGPLSDIDLAIYVKDPSTFTFQNKLALYADICRILKSNNVDLVVLNQMDNLIIHEKIIHNGELFYLKDRNSLDCYVFVTIHAICDFKWFRKEVA